MNEINIIYNNKIYNSYYDLLVQKITDDTSKRHYLSLKDDCIILIEEDGMQFDERNNNIIVSIQVYKAKQTYKIEKNVYGIYVFPSSDYKFYFLDKAKHIDSREKGLNFVAQIIFLRYYKWNLNYGNKTVDILPQLFTDIEIDDYVIKPNTVLSLNNDGQIELIEDVNLDDLDVQFKSSFF